MIIDKKTNQEVTHKIIPSSDFAGLVLFGGSIRSANAVFFMALTNVMNKVKELNKESVHNDIEKRLIKGGFSINEIHPLMFKYTVWYELDFEFSLYGLSKIDIENKLLNITKKLLDGDQVVLTIQSIPDMALERIFLFLNNLNIDEKVFNQFKEVIAMRCCQTIGVEVEYSKSNKYFINKKFY